MSYEKLMAAGAEAAGGQVFINRVAMAFFGNEGFTLTEAGEKWVAEQDAAKPTKAARATKKDAPAVEPAADLLADLDKL